MMRQLIYVSCAVVLVLQIAGLAEQVPAGHPSRQSSLGARTSRHLWRKRRKRASPCY